MCIAENFIEGSFIACVRANKLLLCTFFRFSIWILVKFSTIHHYNESVPLGLLFKIGVLLEEHL